MYWTLRRNVIFFLAFVPIRKGSSYLSIEANMRDCVGPIQVGGYVSRFVQYKVLF